MSRRRAVSAPTLSSSPTFCTTMWMSRRSCWPRCVAVNGAPGPSAATASLEISIAAACALGACPPLRSMASLMRRVRREFSARSAGRSMRARERRRDRRGCFRARLRRLENGYRGLSAGARARVAPGERLVRKVGRGVSRRRGRSAARRGQAGADGTQARHRRSVHVAPPRLCERAPSRRQMPFQLSLAKMRFLSAYDIITHEEQY